MKRSIIALICVAISSAAYAQGAYDVLSLNSGDDSHCHYYVIGDRSSNIEIAAMLEDAAKGARLYGCVNIIVDHGNAS